MGGLIVGGGGWVDCGGRGVGRLDGKNLQRLASLQ